MAAVSTKTFVESTSRGNQAVRRGRRVAVGSLEYDVGVPVAITRAVSSSLASCELTHLARVPIDVELARAQHRAYERALADAGYRVEHLDATADMPDSVFVEDIAIVFDELAIITRPGAESRRIETPAVADALAPYRPLEVIEPPGIVDGGDVLLVGHHVFVGRSTRTNDAAIAQMRRILGPRGYTVCAVAVRGCLHLKSAATALADDLLLVNPEWLDAGELGGIACVEIDPGEPQAANALRLDDRIIFPAAFPRTADRLARRGLRLQTVDASEVAKAEGAVTCCSLIVQNRKELT
jgi:dimethylargininase